MGRAGGGYGSTMTASTNDDSTGRRGPDVGELQHRIDEVEEHIQEARERTHPHHEHELHWNDSGDVHPELDDKAITPP